MSVPAWHPEARRGADWFRWWHRRRVLALAHAEVEMIGQVEALYDALEPFLATVGTVDPPEELIEAYRAYFRFPARAWWDR